MKTILVTGGAGFLGSHLCARLLEAGNTVIALDNLYTGRKQNIESLLDNPNFSFVEADVITLPDIECDEIYNLACPASPPHYQKDPIFTMRTSVDGARNVLELARKYKAKVFQASTSEVYGDPQIHPQPESYVGHVNPLGIRACYDEGKRAAETLFMDYHRYYGVKIKIVRIFNTYGPHMDPKDGRVVSNFIIQALKGEPLTIYGTGQQTRSFCYVSDLIDGFIKLMNSDDSITGPINIGNPGEFTLLELVDKIEALLGTAVKRKFFDLPQDDPKQRKPDITKAQSVLNWLPKVPLEEGLKPTIEYFRKEISR